MTEYAARNDVTPSLSFLGLTDLSDPMTYEQNPLKRVIPDRKILGKYVEKIASVIFWDIHGRENFYVQAHQKNGSAPDAASVHGTKVVFYEYTTDLGRCFEKIIKYNTQYPLKVIIIGEKETYFKGKYDGMPACIIELKNYAKIIEKKKILNASTLAESLRKLDSLTIKAKEEIQKFNSGEYQETDLVNFRLIEDWVSKDTRRYIKINGKNGCSFWLTMIGQIKLYVWMKNSMARFLNP